MSGRLVEAMCGVAFTDRLLKGELKWEKNLKDSLGIRFFQGSGSETT